MVHVAGYGAVARLGLISAQPQQRGQVYGIVGPAQLKRRASAAAQNDSLPANCPHQCCTAAAHTVS